MTVPANARILSAITKPIVEAAKPAPAKELGWTQLDPSTLSPTFALSMTPIRKPRATRNPCVRRSRRR